MAWLPALAVIVAIGVGVLVVVVVIETALARVAQALSASLAEVAARDGPIREVLAEFDAKVRSQTRRISRLAERLPPPRRPLDAD